MLEVRSDPATNIVEFTIDGPVGRAEFDAVIAEIDRKIEDYGSVNLLEEIRSLGKVAPSVLWDDLKWTLANVGHIDSAAVVCDRAWLEALLRVMQPLVRANVRHFDQGELAAAREWLRDGLD